MYAIEILENNKSNGYFTRFYPLSRSDEDKNKKIIGTVDFNNLTVYKAINEIYKIPLFNSIEDYKLKQKIINIQKVIENDPKYHKFDCRVRELTDKELESIYHFKEKHKKELEKEKKIKEEKLPYKEQQEIKFELISKNINKLSIYDLTDEQIEDVTSNILDNVSISKLEEKVQEVILKLSGVGEPCFGADLKFIALDNQKRLNLIHSLTYNFNIFKANYKNLKKNKYRCREDSDKVFNFLINTQDIIKVIIEYAEFNHKEKLENQKYIEELNKKLLDTGE